MLSNHPVQPTLQPTAESNRFHALDAVRTFALLIGIVHHGIESFVTYIHDWATQDSQHSIVLDVLFYISHIFRMQAFFLMSGFFAHLLYHRRSARAFATNRAKRLLLPFVVFWPILYVVNYHIWVWGIQRVSHLSRQQAIAKLPGYLVWENGFPLMHLWFLYFLILFCGLVVMVRPIVARWLEPALPIRLFVDRVLTFVLTRWWGSLLIGLVMVGPMLGMTDWFGVDTSASGFVPRPAPFLLYGLYFTLGWFLHRQASLLVNFERFRLANLIMSSVLIVTLIALNLLYGEASNPANEQLVLAGFNTLYAFASITTVSAFLGYVMRYFSGLSPRIRYLSDSAYWGYLIHLPIVAFLQVLIAPYEWFWLLKVLLVLVPTGTLVWLTYQFGVRNTWLGMLLNGKRYSRSASMTGRG